MSGDLVVCSSKKRGKNVAGTKSVGQSVQYDSPDHSCDLLTQLGTLRDESRFCDVTLVVKGTRINAHRNVLAASSNYFKAMFTIDMVESRLNEIEIAEVDASTLDALVKFCYSGKIEISATNVLTILPAACLLQLSKVKESCCDFLEKQLNSWNCLEIRAFASTYACHELLRCADKCILRNFQDIVGTVEFHKIPFDQFVGIISNEELVVQSEEQVFDAVGRWLRHDLPEREQFLPRLMEHVRLPLCHPKFLVNTVSKDAVVMANAACRDLVDEAKNYLLLQLPVRGRPSMQGPRTRPRKSFKLGEVLYVVGGYHNGKVFGSVECLAPEGANTEWKRAPPMSRGRFGGGVAVLNNLLYAICERGGIPPFDLQCIERFDPAANRWSGELVRPSSSRAAYALAALDSSLYAVGGVDDEDSVNVVERYDIERQVWTRVAPMNSCRSEHSVSTLNGCLYAIGGTDNESDLKSMERFDPRVGKWEVVCPMSTRRTSLGSAVLDGELYAVGGRGERRGLNLVEKYDPRTDKWTTIVGMKKRRFGVGVAVANGKLYAVGGSDDTTDLDTVEIFDVETNLWNYHSRLNDGRHGAGVGVIQLP